MSHQESFAINQARWDEVVAIHVASPFYRVREFLAGEDILLPIEAAEVGDLRGKSLVHLQCHFGLDTLALARRGATVTGLDFSKNAVTSARHKPGSKRPSSRAIFTTPLPSSPSASTAPMSPGAPSTGCRTSAAGPRWWRQC